MNRILILIAFLATPQLYADPYETAQRFTAGDVISAEVLNDILDRIELSLKDITVAELVGTWSATQHVCLDTLGKAPGIAINADETNSDGNLDKGRGCLYASTNSNFPDFTDWDGVTSMEDGLYGKRTDTITITAVSGSDTAFTFQSENYNFIFRLNGGANAAKLNSGVTHKCAIIGNHGVFGCLLDEAIIETASKPLRRAWVTLQLRRLSPTRFEILGGPSKGPQFNLIVLDKTNVPPEAPTALSASRTAGTVTLSWTVNGSNATGGVVKRKTSVTGSWSTLGTPSTGSYSDSAITLNNSYWYRVFATNANGTSVGSNVVKVTWANTPPSIDLDSYLTIDENTTAIVTVGATDVDGDTLTYSISSQSPGNDATYMSITSGGVLSFDSAPDFENPVDYGTDNTYKIKVTVSDGIDPVTQAMLVMVRDVSN